MPRKKSVSEFEQYQSILLFAVTATNSFSVKTIAKEVLDTPTNTTRVLLNHLTDQGYLIRLVEGLKGFHYLPSDKTKALYCMDAEHKLGKLVKVVQHIHKLNPTLTNGISFNDWHDNEYYKKVLSEA